MRVPGSSRSAGPRRPKIILSWVGLFLAAVLAGEAMGAAATKVVEPPVKTASVEAQRGPVRVMVRLSPAEASLSDLLTLTIRIEFDPAIRVRKPTVDAVSELFVIRDVQESLPRSENNRLVLKQVYLLEPTRIGRLSLAPIRVTFQDARRADAAEQVVETAPIPVEIGTMLDSDALTLDQLRPIITGGVESPDEENRMVGWWLGGLVAVAGLVLLLWRRVAARRRAAKIQTPQELARQEIARLFRQDLAEQDIQRFYVELTDVIRRYLERSLEIPSARQTTAEFLQTILSEPALSARQREQLERFLQSADLVKFAAYQPTAEEVEESVECARSFLGLGAREEAV